MLRAPASCVLVVFALAVVSTACCKRATNTNVVGEWKQPNSPARITFHSDYTLMFDASSWLTDNGTWQRISAGGTWHIAGDEFTVVLRDPARPDEEQVCVYSGSKICFDDLVFGPSRQTTCIGGQQIGESDTLAGGTVYTRIR